MTRPGKIPSQVGFELRILRSRGGRLNHWANEALSGRQRGPPITEPSRSFSPAKHYNLNTSKQVFLQLGNKQDTREASMIRIRIASMTTKTNTFFSQRKAFRFPRTFFFHSVSVERTWLDLKSLHTTWLSYVILVHFVATRTRMWQSVLWNE